MLSRTSSRRVGVMGTPVSSHWPSGSSELVPAWESGSELRNPDSLLSGPVTRSQSKISAQKQVGA